MKRFSAILAMILVIALLFSGCAVGAGEPAQKQYTATFLTLFDTLTTIKGPAESEEANPNNRVIPI